MRKLDNRIHPSYIYQSGFGPEVSQKMGQKNLKEKITTITLDKVLGRKSIYSLYSLSYIQFWYVGTYTTACVCVVRGQLVGVGSGAQSQVFTLAAVPLPTETSPLNMAAMPLPTETSPLTVYSLTSIYYMSQAGLHHATVLLSPSQAQLFCVFKAPGEADHVCGVRTRGRSRWSSAFKTSLIYKVRSRRAGALQSDSLPKRGGARFLGNLSVTEQISRILCSPCW